MSIFWVIILEKINKSWLILYIIYILLLFHNSFYFGSQKIEIYFNSLEEKRKKL